MAGSLAPAMYWAVLTTLSFWVEAKQLPYQAVMQPGRMLSFFLVSRNQEDRIIVRFAKWRVRESGEGGAFCGVKVAYRCFPSGLFNMLVEMR